MTTEIAHGLAGIAIAETRLSRVVVCPMRGALPWFLFWMRPAMETFIGMDYERGLKMLKDWLMQKLKPLNY